MASGWPHLRVLKSSALGPTVVMVPGLLGRGICFHHLASSGPADARVIALDLPGADPREEPLQLSIETMADLFEPQIRGLVGHGPVVFGGFSLGAVIAYELALRWQRGGQPVRGLVALDGYAPGYTSRKARPLDKLRAHARSLARDPLHLRSVLRNATSDALGHVGLEWLVADALEEAHSGVLARRRARRLSAMRVRAERAYQRHERFLGPFCLIRIRDGERASGLTDLHDYGWGSFVSDLHVSVLPDNVRHADFFAEAAQRKATASAFWRWFAERVEPGHVQSAGA
jgi:thioesterase domain-containing protein